MVPEFQYLYTGNEYVKHLVHSQNRITVKSPKFAKKDEYNGTAIRRLMLAGKHWEAASPARGRKGDPSGKGHREG